MLPLAKLLPIVFSIMVLPGCQRKFSEPPQQADGGSAALPPETKGKPDKVSEEPTGLPGYPLVCVWQQAPASDSAEGAVQCFLADRNGEPASLKQKPQWKASIGAGATLSQEIQPNDSVLLKIKASSREAVGFAVQTLQVTVTVGTESKTASGRELLQAASGKTRVHASCKSLFALQTTSDVGQFSYAEINRFTGCEELAQKLMNIQVPDGTSRQLPDTHKTVQAMCTGMILSITVTQPTFQGSTGVILSSNEGCEDLKGLVNNAGL